MNKHNVQKKQTTLRQQTMFDDFFNQVLSTFAYWWIRIFDSTLFFFCCLHTYTHAHLLFLSRPFSYSIVGQASKYERGRENEFILSYILYKFSFSPLDHEEIHRRIRNLFACCVHSPLFFFYLLILYLKDKIIDAILSLSFCLNVSFVCLYLFNMSQMNTVLFPWQHKNEPRRENSENEREKQKAYNLNCVYISLCSIYKYNKTCYMFSYSPFFLFFISSM